MEATELARWTRFAAKGGIGRCTAVQDCVAEQEQDLMFLKVCPFVKMVFQAPDRLIHPSGRCHHGSNAAS